MKKINLPFIRIILVLSVLLAACNSNTSSSKSRDEGSTIVAQSDPVIIFDVVSYDFGTLKQNKQADYTFTFRNIGGRALVINDVQTSCGCTTPKWTRSPVEAGQSGEIQIAYDSKKPGKFTKSITVYSNAENPQVILNIRGEVRN